MYKSTNKVPCKFFFIKRILFFRRRMNLVDIEEVTVSDDFSSEEKYERSPELV